MKIIACIMADFESGPLGMPARLEEELRGVPVLRRTVQRLLGCEELDGIHVLVRPKDHDRAAKVLAGLEVRIETHEAGAPPWRELVASARKWSLDSWGGGVAGMTVFDETLNPRILESIAQRENASAVVDVAPAAVLIDPSLMDRVVKHYREAQGELRLSFTQAPPGLSAMVYGRDLLTQLCQAGQPIGRIMAYHPAEPQRDMVHQKCFYSAGATVMYARGRCLADTTPGRDRLNGFLAEHESSPCSAEDIARWLTDRHHALNTLPDEVEIELTTEDCLPRTTLRPRGEVVGRRGPMDVDCFRRLMDELAQRDDVRVVLGGFGEPLLHPEWPELVRYAHEAGVFGLAIRTSGLTLDDAASTTLSEAGVDIVNVLIDAHSAGTYLNVHGADRYDELMARIESVNRAHQVTQRPQPLLVPEMSKTSSSMDELESFYDHWIQRCGTAVLSGPSHHGRQWADLSVMRMAPPGRTSCRRIFSRAMVLADGRVTICDQDFKGSDIVGSIQEIGLSDIWRGSALDALRRSHGEGDWHSRMLCAACEEWHRP